MESLPLGLPGRVLQIDGAAGVPLPHRLDLVHRPRHVELRRRLALPPLLCLQPADFIEGRHLQQQPVEALLPRLFRIPLDRIEHAVHLLIEHDLLLLLPLLLRPLGGCIDHGVVLAAERRAAGQRHRHEHERRHHSEEAPACHDASPCHSNHHGSRPVGCTLLSMFTVCIQA